MLTRPRHAARVARERACAWRTRPLQDVAAHAKAPSASETNIGAAVRASCQRVGSEGLQERGDALR
eukprot:15383956-Alexandrium_andersonii.AAC.1